MKVLLLLAAIAPFYMASAQTICIDVNNKPVTGRTIYFCHGANSPTVKAKLCVPAGGTLQYLWTYLNESFVKYRTAQFIPIDTGSWEIRIKLPTGVELKDTFQVKYNTQPFFRITPKPALKCEGMPLKLGATKALRFQDYSWFTADAPTQVLSRLDSFAFAQAGITYIVNAIDNNTGCKVGDTVEVYTKQLSAPKLQLGPPDTTLCEGNTLELKNLISNEGTHIWNIASSETSIKVKTSGKYSLTVINVFGCKSQDSINVNILPNPDILVKKDFYACYGTGIQIGVELAAGNPDLYQYLWTGNAAIDNPRIKSPIVKPTTTTVFKVKVFSQGGCSDTASVKVIANAKISVKALSKDTVICAGKQVTLLGTAIGGTASLPPTPYAFTWSSTEAVPNPNNAEVTANPQKTSWYKLAATDAKGCIGYDSIRVRVAGLQASLAPAASICINDSLYFKPLITGGATPYTYLWRATNGLVKDSVAENTFVVPVSEGPASITLSVKDKVGCNALAKGSFTVHSRPAILSLPDFKKLCVGDTLKLNIAASGGAGKDYVYEWLPLTAAVLQPATSNPKIAAMATDLGLRTYKIRVKDSNNCSTQWDSVKVDVVPGFEASLGSTDTSICAGESIQLFADRLFGKGLQFTWSRNNVIVGNDSLLLASLPGIYQLSVVDMLSGCKSVASKRIKVDTMPTIQNITLPKLICNNLKFELAAEIKGAIANSRWTTTGLGTIDMPSGIPGHYMPAKEEQGKIMLSLKVQNKCGISDTSFEVQIEPSPVITIKVLGDTLFADSLITFQSDGKNLDKISWNFGDGTDIILGSNVSHTFLDQKVYTVVAHAQSQAGCNAVDSITCKVIKPERAFEIYIPNVFFPSSQQNDNQALKIFGKNIASTDFSFKVYNRWGQVVFSTTDYAEAHEIGWNGSMANNGELQTAGIYTYTCRGQYIGGLIFSKTGSATLLR